ncbi:MAG: hypothetical protein R2710_26305 [Acidimicrobiales bacterium]
MRNALVSRLQADDFVAELRQRQPGSDAVELLGDEAYRPLGFFDLEGRGDDADLVVRTTQTASICCVNGSTSNAERRR